MKDITYATKIWRGDYLPTLQRHTDADLVVVNNLGKKFLDLGEVSEPYLEPELAAVRQCNTKYLLWYSADVVPPATDWISDALPLLKKYPIVTCLWEEEPDVKGLTDKGDYYENYLFSDQCFIAQAKYLKNIDYDIDHPIKRHYPAHGGNSFERKVAQYLASRGTPIAVLKRHRYTHIKTEEKVDEN